jgi:hypothetical protein
VFQALVATMDLPCLHELWESEEGNRLSEEVQETPSLKQ